MRLALTSDGAASAYEEIVQRCFDYFDVLSQQVELTHEEEWEAWLASQRNARSTEVAEILVGVAVDRVTAESVLGYRLRGRHVAVVAWVDGLSARSDQLTRSTEAIEDFAHDIGARTPLIIGRDRETVWAWLPVRATWKFDPEWASWRSEDVPSLVLAVGEPQGDVAGFRQSHEEARRVQSVLALGGSDGRRVVSHGEPGVAAAGFICADPEAGRNWVSSVLGGLAIDTESAARARHTLYEFLHNNMSFTATAAAVFMHKYSVRYRVNAVEALLPNPLRECRFDVYVALAVSRWLGMRALP